MTTASHHMSKTVESRTERLSDIREFVAGLARRHGFPEEEVANIVLAVDEACTNIIKHAYQSAPDRPIEVKVSRSGDAFEITILDEGRAFDPEHLHAPDLKDHLSHFRRGGLGVYLMKKLMDQVEYRFQPGAKNEVRLVKHLRPSPQS
jgi:serine/threonine-protein kinase RsbW